MRYYDLQIGGDFAARYSSFVNGQTDPGALNIVIDAPVTTFASPMSNASIQLWGVSLQTISQASNFNGASVTLQAGMKPGLPLATAAATQSGIIVQGTINQAFGNWIGTTQTLDLVVTPLYLGQSNSKNIILNATKGMTLASAITQTLTTAFPGYTVNASISPSLVFSQDDKGPWPDLTSFAAHIRAISQSIKPDPNYPGVDIGLSGKTFTVFDGTTKTAPKAMNFYDLIGQPTWSGPNQMQFNTVLRADLAVGDFVQMPAGIYTTTAPSQSQAFKYSSAFQGVFQINQVRHVGNFRQPDGNSWITSFFANALNPGQPNG